MNQMISSDVDCNNFITAYKTHFLLKKIIKIPLYNVDDNFHNSASYSRLTLYNRLSSAVQRQQEKNTMTQFTTHVMRDSNSKEQQVLCVKLIRLVMSV